MSYNLFKNASACRTDYVQVTDVSKKVLIIRWVENSDVKRPLNILPNVHIILAFQNNEGSKPRCKSYRVINKFVKNWFLKI